MRYIFLCVWMKCSVIICYTEWEILEHRALNGIYPSSSTPQGSRNPAEKETETELEAEGMNIKKTMSSQSSDQSTYEGNHREWSSKQRVQNVLCVFVVASSLRFMGFPSVLMSGSLFHVPSLQFFSFCWFGLSYYDVWVFVLPYCILFYWKTGFNIWILSQYKLML